MGVKNKKIKRKTTGKKGSSARKYKLDPDATPIWEKLIKMAEEVPEEELAKIPTDLSVRLDFYLYGGDDS